MTLQIDTAGDPGALLHDLGAEQDKLCSRLMVNITQASGGEFAVMGGLRADRKSVWQLVIDAESLAVRLEAGSSQCSATLPGTIAWHCIEVSIDALSGNIALRVNGVERHTLNTPVGPIQQVWLGGAFFSPGMIGTAEVDQWVISQEPIGVPISVPAYDHGGDPRRWLVVYNLDDADSCAWADTYRARRGVPYANLCGLELPLTESISAAEFETLRQQINAYLDDNNLREQVAGVLLGLNVPGYADVAGQGTLTPIASYLHTDDAHGLPVVNPLYQSAITGRPAASAYSGIRLTGRIDAPSLAEAIAMLDRADALVNQPVSHASGSDVLIDINPDNPNVGPVYTQPVADWTEGDGLSSLRLPATVYDAQAPVTASNDAVVWGWRDAAPPPGYFTTPAGRRAICMQFDPEPDPAVTVRDSSATDWLSSAIQAGYAFTAAPSRAYSLSSLPLPHLFFEGLRQGWTVAEAWLVAQPFVRDGLQIIGDPLMPIAFPKAGYDVYGPAPRLDLIDFDSPLAVLHAGEHAVALESEDLPEPGLVARYLVRQLDDLGRSDRSTAAAFVSIELGQAVRPALPIYPADGSWPAVKRGGRLVLSAHWPESLGSAGIDSVQLVAQAGTDDPVILHEDKPATGQRRVVWTADLPVVATRYRFTVVQGPALFNTPWSEEVTPAATPTQTITVLEAP